MSLKPNPDTSGVEDLLGHSTALLFSFLPYSPIYFCVRGLQLALHGPLQNWGISQTLTGNSN